MVHSFLREMDQAPPMSSGEVRRRMKGLSAERRAEIVNWIPACAWKVRRLMPLHKRLFLDYLSGEWALESLVEHSNLEKRHRLSGSNRPGQSLTVRGANAAIEGMLHKIVQEPELRRRLCDWSSSAGQPVPGENGEAAARGPEDLLPAPFNRFGDPG
jgi:hypothetical protein